MLTEPRCFVPAATYLRHYRRSCRWTISAIRSRTQMFKKPMAIWTCVVIERTTGINNVSAREMAFVERLSMA